MDHTKEEALKAIKRVSEKLHKSPSGKEYEKHRKETEPSRWDMHEFVDNSYPWSKLKREIGLPQKGYNREHCLDALKEVCKDCKRPLRQSEYDDFKQEYYPSASTIVDKVGSWEKALQKVGYIGKSLESSSGNLSKSKKEKVLEKCDYECRVCGISNEQSKKTFNLSLEIHHIYPRVRFDNMDKAHHKSNLIAVCRNCHTAEGGIQYISPEKQIERLNLKKPKYTP